MGKFKLLAIFVSLCTFNPYYISAAGDTMTPGQPIKDGQTLISESGAFELGFFSPGASPNRYLGIRYTNISDRGVVWVANREAPIASSDGVLILAGDGNLSIFDHTSSAIWSTGTSNVTDPVLQLLDNGNLVLTQGRYDASKSSSLLWQSYDYPSHSLLPGMKLGMDFRTKHEWSLTSWKNDSDPSPGPYSYRLYSHGTPEVYILKESTRIWRSGPWSGPGWDGIPGMTSTNYFTFHLVSNHDELYYVFDLINTSNFFQLVLNPDGVAQRLLWRNNEWNPYWEMPGDLCDTYAKCGRYGVCQNDGSPTAYCTCLRGFTQRSPDEGALRDWSGGCLRRTSLDCGSDGFVKVTKLKLPDTTNTSCDSSKNLDDCRDWCLKNCTCLAFAVISPEGGGCVIWFGEMIDIREYADGGDDLYVRLAASELDKDLHSKKRSAVIIAAAALSGVTLICISLCMLWKKHRKGERIPKQPQITLGSSNLAANDELNGYELSDDVMKDSELPLFPFSAIRASTNNFSNENKLGEGGFGPVYKGNLPNGQEIAVKRLSKGSVQGVEEFKNEIKLIANLQHKNLVRLLGCCIKGEERILVYEYMPNRSLNFFLFDPIRAVSLDWQTRIRVIHGIAQGLLYLHKYSRLRIIHRDLKSSNILLDSDMNPKISDFGIARIFGGNQDNANTNRIVGTYGYMPPEYAIEGSFSEKSDVFSFGVLLLEIVSGRKNVGFQQVGDSRFLLGHAWKLWKDGCESELIDPVLRDSCPLQELTRCVHVGLLCMQEDPAERPTMSSIIYFLSSDIAALSSPKRVAFSTRRSVNADYHLPREDFSSTNELTITAIGAR